MMKVKVLLLFVVLLFSHKLWAQEQLTETTRVYAQEGSKLKITFSIDVKPYEEYIIRKVNVYSGSKTIEAKSISGAVNGLNSGDHVIYWDVMKDVNFLDQINYIEIKMEYTPASRRAADKIKTSEEMSGKVQSEEGQSNSSKDPSSDFSYKRKRYKPANTWNRPYDRFRIGITGGIGGTFPAIPQEAYGTLIFEEDQASMDANFDLNLGITARLHLSKVFGLTAEAAWQRTTFLFDAQYPAYASYDNGYTAELELKYDKEVLINALRVPVMASVHLTSDFAVLGGVYWDFMQTAKISGENSWGGEFYDASGNSLGSDFSSFDEEIEVYSLDEVVVDGVSHYPFQNMIQGYVLGLELDGAIGSLRVLYSFTKNNLVNDTYYENLQNGVNADDVDLVYDLLPQMTDLNITTQQVMLQYTIWF